MHAVHLYVLKGLVDVSRLQYLSDFLICQFILSRPRLFTLHHFSNINNALQQFAASSSQHATMASCALPESSARPLSPTVARILLLLLPAVIESPTVLKSPPCRKIIRIYLRCILPLFRLIIFISALYLNAKRRLATLKPIPHVLLSLCRTSWLYGFRVFIHPTVEFVSLPLHYAAQLARLVQRWTHNLRKMMMVRLPQCILYYCILCSLVHLLSLVLRMSVTILATLATPPSPTSLAQQPKSVYVIFMLCAFTCSFGFAISLLGWLDLSNHCPIIPFPPV